MAGADVGIFGGSGFYSFLEDVEEVELETPYGEPSAPYVVGEVDGTRVAFLPRHGRNHELPPHAIPYRANVWAMRELGVRRIIGPMRSGALKAELAARRVRRLRPVRRPDERPAGHLLRRPGDDARLGRRPVLPRTAGAARRDRARARDPGARRRHGRHDPGAAVLDARRVALVPGRRLGRDQHDRVPRGLPRPRARALLREHLDGHRPRRRRARGGCRRLARARRDACSTRTTSACASCCSRSCRRSPPQPEEHLCATALRGARF